MLDLLQYINVMKIMNLRDLQQGYVNQMVNGVELDQNVNLKSKELVIVKVSVSHE